VESGDRNDALKDESYNPEKSLKVDDDVSKDINNLVEQSEEHFNINEEPILAQEPAIRVVTLNATYKSALFGICDVPEVRKEPMEATILFPNEIVFLNLVVLPLHEVPTNTKSTTQSFAWA